MYVCMYVCWLPQRTYLPTYVYADGGWVKGFMTKTLSLTELYVLFYDSLRSWLKRTFSFSFSLRDKDW
jgi:hypothetical protein